MSARPAGGSGRADNRFDELKGVLDTRFTGFERRVKRLEGGS
jgi:hypothetical protein